MKTLIVMILLVGASALSSCASTPDAFDLAIDSVCTARAQQKAQAVTPTTK